MADTFKQVTIHKKYMISGGIGPIFGGKVTLTPSSIYSTAAARDALELRRRSAAALRARSRPVKPSERAAALERE